MKKLSLMIVIALVGLAESAYAFCVPGTVEVCFKNGKQGTRTCGPNGVFGPCVVPNTPPPPSGYGRPKYKVLTVVYSPPGTQGGGSTSSVKYGSGSTWGSTSSAKNTFKQQYTATVSATGGFLGESTGSLIFGYGRSSTDSTATEIKKTASTQISLGGPSVDGIDHNRDQIWLWLNPKLRVSLPTQNAIEWKLDSSEPMDIQYVYVGHLKDPSQMPPGVAQRLAAYGITTADYAEILEANPFANGPIPINTARYVSLNTTFPYEPPYAPGDPVPTLNFTATYSSTDTSGSEVANEYKTGVTWEGGLDFISLVSAKLKVANEWTWTDTKSLSTDTGTTESASVTVGGPAFGYTGPTDMGVYYDILYKSFLFVPYEGGPSVQGWIYSRSNLEVAGKEVRLVANGVTYRTFAGADGEFRFHGTPTGSVQLRVDRVSINLQQISEPVDIELP